MVEPNDHAPRQYTGPVFGVPDLRVILAVGALALIPRLEGAGRRGLTHFDEGAYALGCSAVALGTAPEGFYPHQHYLSPPLYFGLSGMVQRFFGGQSDQVLLWVSTIFGILTVPLVYLLGRAWHGPKAGAGAAALVALNDFHIHLSKAALTDAMFAFWFLLALLLFTGAEKRESLRLALLAGVATGLAWNSKYHGWMAVVVAVLGILPGLRRRRWQGLGGSVARLALATVTAILLYLPWFLYVRTCDGGYARLLEEHARFLSHARDSAAHVLRHFESQLFLDGYLTRLSLPVAFLAAWILPQGPRLVPFPAIIWCVGLALLPWATSGILIVVALGLAALLPTLRRSTPGAGIHAALFVVFAATTPLYHPYARLLLPWMLATALFAGASLAWIQRSMQTSTTPSTLPILIRHAGWLVSVVAVAGILVFGPRPALWAPSQSDGMKVTASRLAATLPPGAEAAVIGEPALVFYLRNLGLCSSHLDHPEEVSSLTSPPRRILLVEGLYARRTGELKSWFRSRPESATPLASADTSVTAVRMLDDFRAAHARDLLAAPHHEPYRFNVYPVAVAGH